MRKPSKYGVFCTVLAIALLIGIFAAFADGRQAEPDDRSERIPPRVFVDHSPKPPQSEEEHQPPLPAERVIEILNKSYEDAERALATSDQTTKENCDDPSGGDKQLGEKGV